MLKIDIICVGKLKEKFFRDAENEYIKRLSRYSKINVIEVKDEPTPDKPTETEKNKVLSKEGEAILKKLAPSSYVIALCVEGSQMPSETLAKKFESLMSGGCGYITLIIGGSMGLSDEVKNRAGLKLSFSEMTFPHRLMRIILLEQVYRAFTIIEGKTYHK